MRNVLVVLCTALIAVQTAAAQASSQPPGVGRAIQMPDTMGANFNVADSATAKSKPDDFDFMIGVWVFKFQQRRPDGTFNPPFNGHWVFEKKRSSGALIEDHWRGDAPGQTWDDGTWSYRTYNSQRGIWEMVGMNTNVGTWLPGLMWRSGDDRLVTEWYGPDVLVRFRYFAIKPDRFLWRADRSTDHGKTWIRDWWTMEVTRIAR